MYLVVALLFGYIVVACPAIITFKHVSKSLSRSWSAQSKFPQAVCMYGYVPISPYPPICYKHCA